MNNLDKYNQAFIEILEITKEQLGDGLTYQSVENWDSVGHMGLVGELEDAFDIMMETDDIIDFDSYNKGKELLLKYDIAL